MKETFGIELRHNIEVAHRLTKTLGKCEAIHGHSMWVELYVWGDLDENGLCAGIEFGAAKRAFRGFLDSEFDHRVLLNKEDPFAGKLFLPPSIESQVEAGGAQLFTPVELPGLALCSDDPTTENIAKWIGAWGVDMFEEQFDIKRVKVVVHETSVNMASWEYEA